MEVDIGLWDKQLEYISSTEKSVLLSCGVGFGKTYANAVFAVISMYKYPGTRIMMVARDVPQFKKSVLPELLKVFQMFKLEEHIDYKYNRQSMEFTFTNGVIINGVGANNYDSAFRGPNIAIIIADEVEYYKQEAWTTMLSRLRVKPELLRCSSTPCGFNFIYEYFDVKKAANKKVIHATTHENLALSEEYIQMLKDDYSPRLFQQEVLAQRLRIKEGSVYDEFDRNIHVQECRHLLKRDDYVHFFTDYNISNYCGVYMFHRDGCTYAIGEEHLKFQGTEVMAPKVKAKYPNAIVIGDSTGNNKRDTAITKTNYQIFESYGLTTQRFRNPPVESRVINANSRLFHRRVVIDPSCVSLIKDMELLGWKEDGSGIDKSNINLSHASDAWGYGIWYFQPLKKDYAVDIIMR